jgi:hypothetical protein
MDSMHQVAAPLGVSAEVQLPAMAEARSVIVRARSNEVNVRSFHLSCMQNTHTSHF